MIKNVKYLHDLDDKDNEQIKENIREYYKYSLKHSNLTEKGISPSSI